MNTTRDRIEADTYREQAESRIKAARSTPRVPSAWGEPFDRPDPQATALTVVIPVKAATSVCKPVIARTIILATATSMVTFSPRDNGVMVITSVHDHVNRKYSLTHLTMTLADARTHYSKLLASGFTPW